VSATPAAFVLLDDRRRFQDMPKVTIAKSMDGPGGGSEDSAGHGQVFGGHWPGDFVNQEAHWTRSGRGQYAAIATAHVRSRSPGGARG